MIELNLIWIFLFIVYILSFASVMLFSFLFRNKENSQPFSFLNCFPFEYFSNRKLDPLLYVFSFISFCPLFLIIPTFGEMSNLALFNLLIACFFGLAGIAFTFVCKISTTYLKTHFKLATFLYAFAFLLSALVSLHFFLDFEVYSHTNSNGTLYLVLGILCAFFTLTMLVLLFNPKLKDWYKLDVRNVDGDIIYNRQKFVSFAYTEWLSILIIFLSEFIFFISLIKI